MKRRFRKAKIRVCFIVVFLFFTHIGISQKNIRQTLLAKENIPSNTISAYRWWNVLHYDIDITPDYSTKFIAGTNAIEFCALQTGREMQIDLQPPMLITAITWKQSAILFKKTGNAYIITFPKNINRGKTETITIHFEGHPQITVKPPWGSGWIWTTDKKGRPWMSVACEGSGGKYMAAVQKCNVRRA